MSKSKTPQFDARIDKILNELVPHFRVCADCKKEFQIESEDIKFLKMLRVPAPTLCPKCRQRRRLAFNNYSNIYKRKCDVPGHTDVMISIMPPVMPWISYDHETYYSDLWDPFSYGITIDESKSFFDQFLGILKEVPQPGVRRGVNCIKCDFAFYGGNAKDCYYAFGCTRSEDIMFSSSIYDSRHIVDSYCIRDIDTGFNNIATAECYKCFFAYFSSNCIECDFIFDCRNCQNCFGCVNLRNKNYCWFNEQLSKEEYQKRKLSVDLGSRQKSKEYKEKFWNFVKKNPVRSIRNSQSVDVSGNDIKRSKNCHHVYQTEDSENLRYASFVIFRMKDSMDIGFSGRAEKNYEAQNASNGSSNIKFSFSVKSSIDCEYIMTCKNCKNCFGCVGLNNAAYCIFNKQYSPEEYWKVLDGVKTKMLQDGTYGEFFPMSFAPHAYDSSLAQIIYPMTEGEAKERGLFWQGDIDVDVKNIKTIQVDELSDNIKDITDEIYNIAIIGEGSKKPFKVTPREVTFYKQYGISLPTDTPYQRIINRFKLLNNFQIYQENCYSCNKRIESSYKKSDGYKPYCEECYLKEVV